MKKKTVLIFGTFDLFHPGHRSFIKQAAHYGRVTAVVARDVTVRKLKKKKPHDTERRRVARLAHYPLVAHARLGNRDLSKRYQVLTEVRPDIICLGYDQTHFIKGLSEQLKALGLRTKIIRLKPFQPHRYKTSIVGAKT